MERYLYTAGRYRWIIAAILLILAVSGSASAYQEYVTTFESAATVWVSRNSQSLLQVADSGTTDQPALPNFQTPANEYAEVLNQLVQTQAFLREVIGRTSQADELAKAPNQLTYLDDVRKRFKIQALGTNLVKVSFHDRVPQSTAEIVAATLAVRDERIMQDQLGSTTVTSAFYQKEFDLAQSEALRAQQQLDRFNAGHQVNSLNAADDYQQRQLRLGSDLAQVRLQDLKNRLDRSSIASALIQLTNHSDVEIIDRPEVPTLPSGGLRQAAFLLGVAAISAVALAGLVIVLGTLLQASIESEADIARLGATALLATIPQVARRRKGARGELRAALAAAAFGPATTASEAAS